MRVLIVDDSVVFRSAIKAALAGVKGIDVIGSANNGRIALQKIEQSSIDLITLDMEMPELSGIETIRALKKMGFKTRIIVFSAHSTRGSEIALEALAAGADDFVAKPSGSQAGIEAASVKIKEELLPKVLQFLPKVRLQASLKKTDDQGVVEKGEWHESYLKRDVNTFLPAVIVIGCSTGGPPALETILKDLPSLFRIPILIVQHMPPIFTASLARRIEQVSGIKTAEAIHGEEICPHRIYIAPGDFHFKVEKKGTKAFVLLDQSPLCHSVRPAVDLLFESVGHVYGALTMAFVLTGMGEDGLMGARVIKKKGGAVMIQERKSCVVFGMPGVIYNAHLYDAIGNLEKIHAIIQKQG